MTNNQNSPIDTDKMKKHFDEFSSAEQKKELDRLQRDRTKKAENYIRELLDDPYTPAKIKIALNIAMKTIELEFK